MSRRRAASFIALSLLPLGLLAPAGASAAPGLFGTFPLQAKARGLVAGPVATGVTASTVAGDCDVDGDGRDDVLTADNQRPFSNAFVVYGKPAAVTDLLASYAGLRITGLQGSPTAAIACAGDVNGDGLDDVIAGSWQEDPNGRQNAGSAFVVFGRRGGATVDVRTLGSAGYRIDGAVANDRIGVERISGAGDVNGDGRDDVLVGANGAAARGSSTGAAFVVFGRGQTTPVDLAALGGGGYRIQGAQGGDRAGFSLANAGDVNADGRPDQLLGAYTAARERGATAGEAYVVFGRASNQTVDLAALGKRGITIRSAAAGDRLGIAVAGAGDVNGDRRADVVVGADGSSDRPGRAFVVFGGGARTVDTAALGRSGFALEGAVPGGNAGYAVAGLPDSNADGLAEVVVGAYDADPAGLVYIVYGRTATSPVVLSDLPRRKGLTLAGGASGDRFGRALAAGGNALEDDSTTLIVGADAASPLGRSRAGQVELFAVSAEG